MYFIDIVCDLRFTMCDLRCTRRKTGDVRLLIGDWRLVTIILNIWLEGRPLGLPGSVGMRRTGTPVAGRRSAGNATMTAVSRICFARTPLGCDMLPHPPYPTKPCSPKGCKTTIICVVPAGRSIRGMPHRSTGLPSLRDVCRGFRSTLARCAKWCATKKTVPGNFRKPLVVAFYDCILDLRLKT